MKDKPEYLTKKVGPMLKMRGARIVKNNDHVKELYKEMQKYSGITDEEIRMLNFEEDKIRIKRDKLKAKRKKQKGKK